MATAAEDRLRTIPNEIDADFVVDTLLTSLSDPHNPQHCAPFLNGCLLSLFHAEVATHNNATLCANRPEFFDTCIRFITATRSTEENNRLQREMSACKCDVSHEQAEQLHDCGATSGACTYKDLGFMLAHQISSVLLPVRDNGRLHKVERNQRRAVRTGKPVPWPRSPQDVLPYGVKNSIAALAAWMEFGFSNDIRLGYNYCIYVGFLASIIALFKREVILPILESPTLPGRIISFAESPLLVFAGRLPMPSDVGPDGLMLQITGAAKCYYMIVDYFDEDEFRMLYAKAIEQLGYGNPNRSLMGICSTATLTLPILLQRAPPESQTAKDIQWCINIFSSVGAISHRYLDLPYDTAKYGPTILDSVRKRRELEKFPATRAYSDLMRLWVWERCWSPGCRQTFVGAGRSFAACSGCARVTYCSKECLARAWKHENVPHREVCKKIKYIVDATDLGPKPNVDGAPLFPLTCFTRNIDNGPLADFSSHMAKLQKHLTLAPR